MTVAAPRANVSVNVLRLLTFGGLGVEADTGTVALRLRPPRLALLAVLAAAGERGASREKLCALLWPDSDEERARHSLRQQIYGLRRDLGRDAVRSTGTTLTLDEAVMGADVIDFRAALSAGDRERAVSLARGTFLDGFYLPSASTFERWVEEERGRLTAAKASALLSLATDASRANDREAAVEWWRQLTQCDALSGRFALGYLKALAARGDRAEALAFVRQHEAIVRRELEADPDAEVLRLEAELRALPAPAITRREVNGAPVARPVVPQQSAPAMTVPDPVVAAAPNAPRSWRAFLRPSRMTALAAIVVFVVLGARLMARERGWVGGAAATPTIAVGFINEGGPDGPDGSFRVSRVLTDMIATDLARVDGLAVLTNSRLLELMRPGQDSAAGYAEAARRAGASELLEGQLLALAHDTLQLEMRRVELRTGLVKDVYRVRAVNRYALVDSLTRAVAKRFALASPKGSIAQATTTSPVAYRLYDEGLRAYFQGDMKGAQRLVNAALAEDSSFAMAAYWVVKIGKDVWDPVLHQDMTGLRPIALRLAAHAPERERLMISADLLSEAEEPRAIAVAESLTTRFHDDPRAFGVLGHVYSVAGDWTRAAGALERAIALDSVAERPGGPLCMLCEDFNQLANVYFWSDSLAAVLRLAQRYRALRPSSSSPFYFQGMVAQRLGDSAAAYDNFARVASLGGVTSGYQTLVDLGLESYDRAQRGLTSALGSSIPGEYESSVWWYIIALRNQGRIRDAEQLLLTGTLPGLPPPPARRDPSLPNGAILALALGDPRKAVELFGHTLHLPLPAVWSSGTKSRHLAWNGTLTGMALAAAGDTVAVRALADSVEVWGRGSLYGRDRRAHHYLRGLVHQAGGRYEDAVREFRAAIHSSTLGFTRVNYELARSLLRLRRPQEAAAALQPALRGDLEAGNLYITHTELHELLAQAFDSAGMADSAAVHYRAVVKAWQRADPEFGPRREAAQRWLARHTRLVAASTSIK